MLRNVLVPADVGEAAARLADDPAATLLAGGTLLMPWINNDVTPIETLVSTRRLGIAGIEVSDGTARVGAATTLTDLGADARVAFLRPVVESIASPIIRNLATVAGNLFARQPYGDLAVALLALDAVAEIAGSRGSREAPVAEVLEQRVEPGEIIVALRFAVPADGTWFWTKAMRRKLNSAAIIAVAAVVETGDADAVSAARIALGGSGSRPTRAHSAEAALLGKPLDQASVSEAAQRALDDAEPFTDAYASAWYRARVLPVHLRRAILGA